MTLGRIQAKQQIERIFHPKRLAVIGASGDAFSYGGRTILTLLNFGYKGELYPSIQRWTIAD